MDSRKVEQCSFKKAKIDDGPVNSEPTMRIQRVTLNPADCTLNFIIKGNGTQGSALYGQGFAYCWSGARANVGITGGKYCFGFKIILAQPVEMEVVYTATQQPACVIGISRGDDTMLKLGVTKHSFGFGGSGRFSVAGKFSNYGEKFGVGDTIICAVNLENKPLASIGFSKNGKWFGPAMLFDAGPGGAGVVDSPLRKLQWESALFPHVLLKNVVVQAQFSVEEGLVPEKGYKPWASALEDGKAIIGPAFSNINDCEVMMMVGLPGSGKTTWAENRVKTYPEKRYNLLGTKLVLEHMKVPSLFRGNISQELVDRLRDQGRGIFNILLHMAGLTPRNYIIDQWNVLESVRKHNLKPFSGFQKIAVVMFPKPEVLMSRAVQRYGKQEVADCALAPMIAKYALPESKNMPDSDEILDEIIYPELDRVNSHMHLAEMKQACQSGSNLNLESPTTYLQEQSVDRYNMPSPHDQGALSGGYWQNCNTPSPSLNYSCQMPSQVNSTYQGSGLHDITGFYSEVHQGNQNPCCTSFIGPSPRLTNPATTQGSSPYGTPTPTSTHGTLQKNR